MPDGDHVDGGVGVGSRGAPQRVRLSESDFERLDKDDLCLKWHAQDEYVDYLEEKLNSSASQSSSKRIA